MLENIRRIALYEDSLDSVLWSEYGEILGIWTQLPPEQQTPQGLWAAVGDHWQRKQVYVENVGHPVTPEELFDWLQDSMERNLRAIEGMAGSLQEQFSRTAKILASSSIGGQWSILGTEEHTMATLANLIKPYNFAAISDITKAFVPAVDIQKTLSAFESNFAIVTPKFDYALGFQGTANQVASVFGSINSTGEQLAGLQNALWIPEQTSLAEIFEQTTWGDALFAKFTGEDMAKILGGGGDSIQRAFGISSRDFLSAALFQGSNNVLKGVADHIASVLGQLHADFSWFDQLIQRAGQQMERGWIDACEILEIDPDEPDAYYDEYSLTQLIAEAEVVFWMKETVRQGRLPEIARLDEYQKTGRISTHTLGRFWRLLLGESPLSVQRVDYHLPPTSKFEVQIQYDPALPPQQMFFPVAPGQKPVVRVLVNGESNQLWQPVQRQLWLPDGGGRWAVSGAVIALLAIYVCLWFVE